jgi:GTP cyclohydrolase II
MEKTIEFIEKAYFPTRWGEFLLYAFEDNKKNIHLAIIKGDVENKEDVPCRIHSKCLTGDALGSLRCDCQEQYQKSMEYIGKSKEGLLLYLDQEGRGIGLKDKIKAYALQDKGMDTIQANLALGHKEDERDYFVAAQILDYLKVKSIALISNNPNKIEQLKRYGINITKRINLKIVGSKFSEKYLKIKKEKMGHKINEQD